MKKGFDIYNHQRILESALTKLEEADISERNKKIILDFWINFYNQIEFNTNYIE